MSLLLLGAGSVSANSNAVTPTAPSAPPSGAVGLWYADEYTTSPRRVIPNAASVASVSANLFSAPRRVFAGGIHYTANAATVTDDAAVGPSGASGEASTVVGFANTWRIGLATSNTFPAGTYTVCCWVKSNTGSDQTFTFSIGTRSSIKTATASWQRFTHTFITAANTTASNVLLCNDASTTASLQICDFELFAGSSDLGGVTGTIPDGHLYLGAISTSTQPAVASNELDLSNQGYGTIQFDYNYATSGGFTYQVLLKKVAAGSAIFHATLSKVQSYADFSMTTEVTRSVTNYIGGTGQFYNGEGLGIGANGMWELLNQGYHVHTMRYDGTNCDWWIDDVLLHRKVVSPTSKNIRDFVFGILNSTSNYGGEKVYCAGLWHRALTDSEVRDSVVYAQSRAASAGLTATNHARILCFEGDSVTSTSATRWPYYYGTNLATTPFVGHNFAIGGSWIAGMETRTSLVDAVIPLNTAGRKFVLSVLIGANDLTQISTATWLAQLRSYLLARKAAGWTVVLGTPTPRTLSGFAAARLAVLPTLRSWTASDGVDYLIDFAADATMGPDAAASNASLYFDGVHPSVLGDQNLAAIAATVFNAI